MMTPIFFSQISPYILIILLTLTTFPQKSLQDSPYVCPYPCLPPPTGWSPNPPKTPDLPPPSTPTTTTTTNCPPPPSSTPAGPTYYSSPPPPSSSGQYYQSPPPPSSSGYNPTYGYYPPPGGSTFPYGNAPPPPNPIWPYFPYYFKNPPPSPQESSTTRVMAMIFMNQFLLHGCLWVMLLLPTVAFFDRR